MILTQKIKTVRKFDWFEFVNDEMTTFKILPDSSVRNWRNEDVIRTMANMFKLPIERIIRDGLRVKGYKIQERMSFEIDFVDGKINFFLSVPKNIAPLFKRRMSSIWDKSTFEIVERHRQMNLSKTVIHEIVTKKHDIYSLNTDERNNDPLQSIIESGKMVEENEWAKIYVFFDPVHQLSYQHELESAWDKLKSGKAPRKINSSFKNIVAIGAIGLTDLFRELVTGIGDLIGDGKTENIYTKKENTSDPEALRFTIENLTQATKTKRGKPGIKTYIWALAQSDDKTRAELISRTLSYAYHDMSGDNEFEPSIVYNDKKRNEIMRVVNTHKSPKINLRSNLLSTAEASKLTQIAGRELQESHPEIERIDTVEVPIDNKLTNETGIILGEMKFKGDKVTMYQPINDWEELCLPSVGIGGMGQGKTQGIMANTAVEAVLKGFGALVIDPAKRQIGDQIEPLIKFGILRPEQFVRINLKKTIISLDWIEALYDEDSRDRLAGTIIDFFNIADDTTGQTERFLRAAVMIMKTGKLNEIFRIFEDDKYLKQCIDDSDLEEDDLNLITLKQFMNEGLGRRRQILSPIYNRMSAIMSDSHLRKCIKSNDSLDMVEILSQKKLVVFDLPDDELVSTQIDTIVNILMAKIDLAMRLRGKYKGKDAEFPFFVMMDEPHKYSRSAKIWEAACVESRKWRVKYFWTFHYWEQITPMLQRAIKAALPHYHLYPSSKDTFKNLSEQIYPFTIEDGMKLKRFHAINLIRVNGEYMTPFIAKMALPPSMRYKKTEDKKTAI